jgi:hypothetical protein
MSADIELRAMGVTMDCADVVRLADFWQAALGFRSRTGDERHTITLSDSVNSRTINHLTLQRVPEPKSAKHRIHIDLFPQDPASARAELLALGATVLSEPDFTVPGHLGFHAVVMADPEGGEFCLVMRAPKD